MLVALGADTALFDPHRTAGNFGAGLEAGALPGFAGPTGIDLFGQFHRFAPGELPRGPAGSAGVPLDGSGIPFGGNIWVGGAQWRTRY